MREQLRTTVPQTKKACLHFCLHSDADKPCRYRFVLNLGNLALLLAQLPQQLATEQ